jgi:hypothetical protein
MKSFAYVLLFILLAMLCWGIYGPLLKTGTIDMNSGGLPPFLCVGVAYFVIAVVGPILLLKSIGERGHWTASGLVWSMIAGGSGAVGALGVILAMKNGGNPIYVMPLVFGGAPVVNSILTIALAGSYKQVGPIFIAGLIIVLVGAVTVMVFAPHGEVKPLSTGELTVVLLFTALTAVCFGMYGPTLHKGQLAMGGSRLRPFLGVGLAYFLIAVLVPGALMVASAQPVHWTASGIFWSLGGGAAGAIGALGIILAFNFGGKPIYVMPLVFGGAPVVNTFVEVARNNAMSHIGPIFIAGLILVAAGAVTVLVFAPRAHGPTVAVTPTVQAPKPSGGSTAAAAKH